MTTRKRETTSDHIDFNPILADVVRDFGKPVSANDVALVTEIEIPRVTAILDDLVTAGVLVLGDDQLYRIPDEPADPADPVKSVEIDDAQEHDVRTVLIPTGDLLRLVTTLNLPPQLLEGLGQPSNIKGMLSYEPVEATVEDPHPMGSLHITIEGSHSSHFTPPNHPSSAAPFA